MLAEKQKLIEPIRNILSKNRITKAALFGSFVRESEKYNDIDILIEAHSHTLFDLLKIEIELEQLLHTKIDLVEFKALKKSITDQVLKECISII